MVKDIIAEKYDSMSKTHKKIANYILGNITESSYSTINKLANEIGVGEATVIRFCTFLGYKGYPEFKEALKESAQEQNGIKDRLRESYEAYGGKESGIVRVFRDDMARIENTLGSLKIEDFFEICQQIILARKIYIIACRSAASLGQFFQYYLNMTLGNVELITDQGNHADRLCDVEANDLVIGMTFSRYSKRTVELFRYSSGKGAKTVAITDFMVSPLIKYADFYLLAETSMPSYFDSFAAPLTLISAILTEIGRNRNIELEHRVAELDKFYNEFNIFE